MDVVLSCPELLEKISAYLDIDDLKSFRAVNRDFHRATERFNELFVQYEDSVTEESHDIDIDAEEW